MSFIHSPSIVHDSSLVLCLDAANKRSYPGSGSTWTDLTNNGNNGALQNSAGFSSVYSGGITLNGSNQFINVPYSSALSPSTAFTLAAFTNYSSYGYNYGPIIYKQNNYNSAYEQYSMYYYTGGNIGFTITGTDRNQVSLASSGGYYNKNIYAVATCDRITQQMNLYINGILVSNTTFSTTFDTSSNPVNIGGTYAAGFNGMGQGTVYTASIYNRALNANEILQNYNALKGRFLL